MKNYELQAFLQFDDQDGSGNAAANQTFNVTIARGGSGDATIYQDANGVTELTRPFQTDQYGRFKFYAPNGYYNILFDDPDVANLNNLLDRDIFEPQDIPSETKLYAMTKAEFDALAEQRKRVNAGSGFLEWGRVYSSGVRAVNEGIWEFVNQAVVSTFQIGTARPDAGSYGTSRTEVPKALINGNQCNIFGVNFANSNQCNQIKFPPAPDGTKTYDSATGEVVQHADVATAFASETATNKVITSRKDLVFLESWHEAIEDKDQVYWLGNVQQGANNPYGAPNLTRSDGYTRFGEWDTTTTGKYSTWSALTDAQKLAFIQDPENNIYYDSEAGKFIQVRYRMRVIEGLGDNWNMPRPTSNNGVGILRYGTNATRVYPRGHETTVLDITNQTGRWFAGKASGLVGELPEDSGAFGSNSQSAAGLPYAKALPIALVQRLNQGAYHPVYNPNGCARFSDNNFWYNTADTVTSTQDCFELALNGDISSAITGRTDQYKYYDAIYAGIVEDLRLPATKQDYSRLMKDRFNKAIAGTVRGKERLPFTKVFSSVGDVEAGYTIVNQDNPSAVVAESYEVITAEYDSLPWVDIVGDPVRIAAAFPDGVVGQWIPDDWSTGSEWDLNRKAKQINFSSLTNDDGASWVSNNTGLNTITNKATSANGSASRIWLHFYESLSDFTEPTNRNAVEYGNFDTFASSSYLVNNGNRLAGSVVDVIGKVNNENGRQGAKRSQVQNKLDSSFKAVSVLHNSIDLTPNSGAGTEGVKSTPYLVQKGGLLYVQYLSQEIEHDGTDWGDSGFVQIRDGDGTYVNDNGVTLKASCHTDIIPIAIADYTETNK